jgi:hypothetical protein
MKKAFALILAGLMMGMTGACFAFNRDPFDKGETVEPYPILTNGIKLSFSQLDLQYLGRRCSVFYKPGQPAAMAGTGTLPEKMFVRQNGITVENGELVGLSKHGIDINWYFSGRGAHGGSIPDTEIDYIIVEKK